jgi:hypothetical protein
MILYEWIFILFMLHECIYILNYGEGTAFVVHYVREREIQSGFSSPFSSFIHSLLNILVNSLK